MTLSISEQFELIESLINEVVKNQERYDKASETLSEQDLWQSDERFAYYDEMSDAKAQMFLLKRKVCRHINNLAALFGMDFGNFSTEYLSNIIKRLNTLKNIWIAMVKGAESYGYQIELSETIAEI